MPLPRKLVNTHVFERVELNCYDVATRTIIFTGTSAEIANHLGTKTERVRDALKKKYRLLKKYAIRTKSTKVDVD
jgi:hypothetical protein